MGRAVMSLERVGNDDIPCCPHCQGPMHFAPISLGDLIDAWPLPKRIEVDDDGYAYIDELTAIINCPDCFKPSALGIDGDWKLVACRTETDRKFQEAAGVPAVA